MSSVLPEDAGRYDCFTVEEDPSSNLFVLLVNLNDFRYECVAVQEDGEEATTFVDLSVIFAPIIEQEEAYVRRRDGGREVRDK